MSSDNESIPASREPLLLPALIKAHRGNSAGDGTITGIIRGLMDSPVTDAERAGERLRVFGWQVDGPPRARCAGSTGSSARRPAQDLVQFTLSVPGSVSDLPCRVLGLQLQITLNGIENTQPDELDCYMELAEAARDVC